MCKGQHLDYDPSKNKMNRTYSASYDNSSGSESS
jgi:hypothetical protein